MRLLAPIILVILAVAIFFGFTRPQLAATNELSMQAAELNGALENATKLQDARERLKKEFADFRPEDTIRLDKMLPDSIDNVKLIIDIDDVAAKYGMTLRNTTLEADATGGAGDLGPDTSPYGARKLSFRVSGPYAAVQQFLGDLSNSLRLVDPVSLSFRSADKDFYEYDVSIRTYWLR